MHSLYYLAYLLTHTVLSQAEDTLVLILYAERDQPFKSPWREDFLANLSRLLNSILVVQEVEELSPDEVEKMSLRAPQSHQR